MGCRPETCLYSISWPKTISKGGILDKWWAAVCHLEPDTFSRTVCLEGSQEGGFLLGALSRETPFRWRYPSLPPTAPSGPDGPFLFHVVSREN